MDGKKHMGRPKVAVIATGPDGSETRYPSIAEAAKAEGVSAGSISTACTMGWSVAGLFWRREEDAH